MLWQKYATFSPENRYMFTDNSFPHATINCVIWFCGKMMVGARQASGSGLLSPSRSGSKQVNQVRLTQLNKHVFHFTVSVHLPDHTQQRVCDTTKECHCTCCGHLHDYETMTINKGISLLILIFKNCCLQLSWSISVTRSPYMQN